MQLILVRHGQAESQKTTDESRALTDLGQRQANWTAQQIAAHYQPDLFVVSPLLRAQQTLQALTRHYPDVPMITYDGIKPEDDARQAVDWLSTQQGKCIVVVCHMNIVAYMAALLLEGNPAQHPESFQLAEARIFEQPFINDGLSVEKKRFVPQLS